MRCFITMVLVVAAGFGGYEFYLQHRKPLCIDVTRELISSTALDRVSRNLGLPVSGYTKQLREILTTPGACE